METRYIKGLESKATLTIGLREAAAELVTLTGLREMTANNEGLLGKPSLASSVQGSSASAPYRGGLRALSACRRRSSSLFFDIHLHS
jgi:hypothetical protein